MGTTDESMNVADFNTDQYFKNHSPSQWHKGQFSMYCYDTFESAFAGLSRPKKRAFAGMLWRQALVKLIGSDNHQLETQAKRLLKLERKHEINIQKTYVNNAFTISGNTAAVTATVGNTTTEAPTSQTRGTKRKAQRSETSLYDGERSASATPEPATTRSSPRLKQPRLKASPPAPPPRTTESPRVRKPSEEQSGRQMLIQARETLLQDIQSNLTKLTSVQAQLLTIQAQVDRIQESCAKMCKNLDKKLQEIINNPQIIESDTMLTEKDETCSEAETAILRSEREAEVARAEEGEKTKKEPKGVSS